MRNFTAWLGKIFGTIRLPSMGGIDCRKKWRKNHYIFKNPNPDKQKNNHIESNMLYERALGIAAARPKGLGKNVYV